MHRPARNQCHHGSLHTSPSANAEQVGYQPRTNQQLFTASTGSRKSVDANHARLLDVHPKPLVLPADDLAYDPKYPPQNFASWKTETARNIITQKRKTIYVAECPRIDPRLDIDVGRWSIPVIRNDGNTLVSKPVFHDILIYLQAFFFDLSVRKLNDELAFTTWNNSPAPPKRSRKTTDRSQSDQATLSPEFVGLVSSETGSVTRIRTRRVVSDTPSYSHQLNLSDILDHAISIVPTDAYALLLLVDHDLYEDEDDEFCVGRAYGGSRIAIVSAARYQPELDDSAGVDTESGHIWPGSHCEAFIQDICEDILSDKKRKCSRNKIVQNSASMVDADKSSIVVPRRQKGLSKMKKANSPTADLDMNSLDSNSASLQASLATQQPLQAAVEIHDQIYSNAARPLSSTQLHSLYTRRLALTASHELLHCFGLDHCVYLACAMQGTSSIIEDSRQPVYLCPICENKLGAAIVLKPAHTERMKSGWWEEARFSAWRQARRQALIDFCQSRGEADLGFASLGAWYTTLKSLEE